MPDETPTPILSRWGYSTEPAIDWVGDYDTREDAIRAGKEVHKCTFWVSALDDIATLEEIPPDTVRAP